MTFLNLRRIDALERLAFDQIDVDADEEDQEGELQDDIDKRIDDVDAADLGRRKVFPDYRGVGNRVDLPEDV